MKNLVVVIPTYWSRKAGEAGHPEDSIFDHPTPIDGEGTLGRCLDSLKSTTSHTFKVLIIAAPVNPSLSEAVEEKIELIMAPYRKNYPIGMFGPSDLALLKSRLEENGMDPGLVGLDAYARVRNCQLLGSVLLNADLIAAIDDDEVVPADYLQKATDYAGKRQAEKRIDGVAGIYLDRNGDYRVKEATGARGSANLFTRKAALMNDEFSSYMSRPGRLVETAIALGGNMVFTRELFMNVPFDPGITRGEDIDYLLNSRMLGFNWFLDRELSIIHLPPAPSEKDPLNTSGYAKMQQDIIRFIYQREKIRLSAEIAGFKHLIPEDFGFYPGEFFKDDLEEQALEALKETRPRDADERFFPEPEKLMESAWQRASKAGEFPAFREKWRKLTGLLESDPVLKERIRKKF